VHVVLTSILVRSGLLTHVRDLANELAKNGIEVSVAIPKKGNLSRDRSLLHVSDAVTMFEYGSQGALTGFAAGQGAALIHAHSPQTFDASLVAARRRDLPLVVTLHSVSPWPQLYPKVLDRASAIIAVGRAQAQAAGPRHAGKVVLIPNGVDLNRFRPDPAQAGVEGPLRVVWFGRYDRPYSRGLLALDGAVAGLRSRGLEIEARMVGYAEGVETAALDHRGWSDDPVRELQWGQVAFGHGRSLREAMACGNVGFLLGHGYGRRLTPQKLSQENYVIDAFPQYGFPAPDPLAIAGDLISLYEDRSLLRDLRAQAQLLAEQRFDLGRMVQRTLEVYRRSRR
jgi:hypothetical protein